MVCTYSLVERLDLLLMAVLLNIRGKLSTLRAKSAHLVGHLPLGIERPKVRNRQSVAHLNTLIYIVINVRALSRAKSTQDEVQ